MFLMDLFPEYQQATDEAIEIPTPFLSHDVIDPDVTDAGENSKHVKMDPDVSHIDNSASMLSHQEEQLYDRQIRLWGVEVQQRIMNARVLFLGKNGIQEEAIKNLVLTGMNVTLANSGIVSEADVSSSYFLQMSDIGKNVSLVHRMREMVLNKDRVKFINACLLKECTVNGIHSYDVDDSTISSYDVISFAGGDFPLSMLVHVNEKCRQRGVAFFVSSVNGIQGFIFQDLNNHTVYLFCLEFRNIIQPKFPPNCDILIRRTVAYLLIQSMYTQTVTDPSCVLDLKYRLDEICDAVGTNFDEVLPLFRLQGKEFAVTSGILGGYLALTIRNFVTKQYETSPSLCVFDMNRSLVTTAML
ncbi:hypothetical protein X943_003628 [Babesia divergens]|uniref:THIF-type NAD/FAD binding fold domain-containing protein n=1 Tax=Babesia divergens TaxID=32595 RepID=A0AAD9GEB1_BABDI|nr:hypothetical protein X943_003628 [Babesia divergens]